MKVFILTTLGIALNMAGSALIDAFYHEATIGVGYSDWGYTAWSLRLTGVGLLIGAAVSHMTTDEKQKER